jgi:beta-barrel assembly-enhancing protease
MAIAERLRQLVAVYLALCLVAGPALAAANEPTLPNPGNPKMSREQQIQLGLQVAREVYKQMPVLPDSSPVTKYIQEVGKRLVATIPPDTSWPFQFHVVADKEINAFAIPGGPMFVNIGTITAADNEGELAGVMAHEIGHVYMQHSAKQQQKGSLLGGIAGVAGIVAGATMGGGWGMLAQSGIQFGAGTLMLKYSRSDESQADSVGAIILWKADYNPVGLATFFDEMAKKAKSGGPEFLSSHPNPGNRRAAIEKQIAKWPPRNYRHDDAEFLAVKKEAENAKAYAAQEIAAGAKSGRWERENRRNGAVFPGTGPAPGSIPAVPFTQVQPSSNFQEVQLRVMSMQRPENWEVIRAQQQDSVTIGPRAGVSESGGVSYGVVTQVARGVNQRMSPRQITAAIAQSLEHDDLNMSRTTDTDAKDLTVGGVAAGSIELETLSPMAGEDGNTQVERDWLVAVPQTGGRVVVIAFVAPQKHFEELKPTFQKMLDSVKF